MSDLGLRLGNLALQNYFPQMVLSVNEEKDTCNSSNYLLVGHNNIIKGLVGIKLNRSASR